MADIIYKGQGYDISSFDANYSLSGGVTFAQSGTGSSDDDYSLVTEFGLAEQSLNNENLTPYSGKINGTTYFFKEDGTTVSGMYTLKTGTAEIDYDTGGQQGDDIDTRSGGGGIYFLGNNLNYRETVAVQCLNAIIGHLTDPFAYSPAKIKLMVQTAFDFAIEFTNQAIELRKQNAHESGSGDSSEIVPDEMTVQDALNVVAEKLDAIQDALWDRSDPLSAPTSYLASLNDIADIKDALVDDSVTPNKTILTELTDISSKITNVATNIQTGDTAIVTALGGTNTALGNIQTNTGNTADRLLYSNKSAAERLYNIETDLEVTNGTQVVGTIGNKVKDISDDVDAINGKLSWGNNNISALTAMVADNTELTAQRLTHGSNSVAALTASIDSKVS